MADIFISYSHEDRAFVRRIVPALEQEGFSVWWDHTIPPGQSWDSFIARGIKEAKAAIVVWSQTSVASEWVKEEASLSRATGKYLPVQMDGAEPPMGFSRIQAAQLTGWDGDPRDPQWKMLVAEIRRIMTTDGSQALHVPPRQPRPAETRKEKGSPVAAIIVGVLVLAGLGAGGLFYLQQGGGQVAAPAQTAQAQTAQANPPAPQPATQDTQPSKSDEQLSELKRQMADTQAALAEERRLREEAEKAARLRSAERPPEPRAPQSAPVERAPAASETSTALVGQPWTFKLTWRDAPEKPGVATFHADRSVRIDFGAQDISLGTWTQSGQALTMTMPETTGASTFNCTINAAGISCSASYSTRPELTGKVLLTRP